MLDTLTRSELQNVLMEVWEKNKITAVMVTHDVDEALFLSDRIVMMTTSPEAKVGKVLNIAFPRPRSSMDVLNHPEYHNLRAQLINFLEKGHKIKVA